MIKINQKNNNFSCPFCGLSSRGILSVFSIPVHICKDVPNPPGIFIIGKDLDFIIAHFERKGNE